MTQGPTPTDPTHDIGDAQDLTYSLFGINGYYYFIGQQDGLQGVGPFSVQPGDEKYQSEYNAGYAHGRYSRNILVNITI